LFSLSAHADPQPLHSFPTRRSSDLGMAHEPRRDRDEDDRPTSFWKGLARDALVAGLIVAVFLGALYLYAGVWPPLVVVESSSMRSEEHTSELQSRENLVCRLLLEKK